MTAKEELLTILPLEGPEVRTYLIHSWDSLARQNFRSSS